MDLTNQLIELRILLEGHCDGFCDNGKNAILSNKLKILFMLERVDCTPNDFISSLCIAKSNIANLLKKMIDEGIVDSYKSLDNNKNIFYKITTQGCNELRRYKEKMSSQFNDKCIVDKDELSRNLQSVINILKGKEL